MDELPDLAWMQLFSFFEVDELLLLRLVCKRWDLFLRQFLLPRSLFVYEHRFPSRILWSTTSRPIKSNEALNLMKIMTDVKQRFPAIRFDPGKTRLKLENLLFKRMEVLYIYRIANMKPFFQGAFFLFRQLKELHIYNQLEMTLFHLILPCLEIFKLVGKVNYFKLAAPSLQRFTYWQLHYQGVLLFTVRPTSKIKFVETLHFDEKYLNFKSLESLTCLHIGAIPDNLLTELPNLKKVNLFPTEPAHRRIIGHLKEQRSALNRNDLSILISGHANEDLPFRFKFATTQRY